MGASRAGPVPLQVAHDRCAHRYWTSESGACRLIIAQWRPPRYCGQCTVWSRLSSRQAQATLFQTLLTALYWRYARSFRRIQFALDRIARQMPPAPPGYVRVRRAWVVIGRHMLSETGIRRGGQFQSSDGFAKVGRTQCQYGTPLWRFVVDCRSTHHGRFAFVDHVRR